MKYIATITRTEYKAVRLFAPDCKSAIRLAQLEHPGFHCEVVTELGEGDEPGESYAHIASCCNCERPITSGEKYSKGDPLKGEEDICAECERSLNK